MTTHRREILSDLMTGKHYDACSCGWQVPSPGVMEELQHNDSAWREHAGTEAHPASAQEQLDYLRAWVNRLADEMESVGVALDDGRVWARKLRAAAQRTPW